MKLFLFQQVNKVTFYGLWVIPVNSMVTYLSRIFFSQIENYKKESIVINMEF